MSNERVSDIRATTRRALAIVLPEQYKSRVGELVDLQVKVGDHKQYVFNLADQTASDHRKKQQMEEIWQLYFLIQKIGFVATLNYIKDEVMPRIAELILREESEIYSTSVFESPLLSEERRREEITLALNDDKGDLSDMYPCRRCNNPRTYTTSKQTRKADEGATVFMQCPVCNWSGKDSGQ